MYTTCIWTWNAIRQVLSLRNKMKIKLNSEIPFLFLLFQLLRAYLSWKIYIAEKLCLFLKSLWNKTASQLVQYYHLFLSFGLGFSHHFWIVFFGSQDLSAFDSKNGWSPEQNSDRPHGLTIWTYSLPFNFSFHLSLFIKSPVIHKFHLYCMKMCLGERRKNWFSHIVEHDQIIPAETDEM